jgi:hypothetical protein
MNDLREKLLAHKEHLELEHISYRNKILKKVKSLASLEEVERIDSRLIGSLIRDISLYNEHLRDIESELTVINTYVV